MTRMQDGWNIVLSGFWNRSLFMPDWVRPQLFPERQMQIEVALLPALPIIFKDEEVSMEISWGSLMFRPLNLTDDNVLRRAESMARSMLERLPETPVHGVGINFRFREETPPAHVLAMFDDVDDVLLSQQKWLIAERVLTRRLTRAENVLNLSMTWRGEGVDFDFNFHSDLGTILPPRRALTEGRSLALRDEAISLLRDTYQLKFEDEHAGNRD